MRTVAHMQPSLLYNGVDTGTLLLKGGPFDSEGRQKYCTVVSCSDRRLMGAGGQSYTTTEQSTTEERCPAGRWSCNESDWTDATTFEFVFR